MSDDARRPDPGPSLTTLVDQINELTIEMTILRESIVTAAEWDNQMRQERQRTLDAALSAARMWMRVSIGVNVVLALAVFWLLVRVGF